MNNFGYQPSESNKGVKPNLPKTDSDTKKNQLDTYIDVLKEESVRLSNMIAKLNDKIQEAEKLIKEQNEPKFELAQDEKYYFINFLLKGLCYRITLIDIFGCFCQLLLDLLILGLLGNHCHALSD